MSSSHMFMNMWCGDVIKNAKTLKFAILSHGIKKRMCFRTCVT